MVRAHSRRRPAFTIVEMMVATALILFMMYIISAAFEKALESFRILKSQGDLQEKLRATSSIIRLDLTADHFSNPTDLVSGQRMDQHSWSPPQQGYFRIMTPPNIAVPTVSALEGSDPDDPTLQYYQIQNASYPKYLLQFTVNYSNGHPTKRDAKGRRDQYFMTNPQDGGGPTGLNSVSKPDYNVGDPTGMYTSYWAEVTYFLQPQNPPQSTGALPLYNLYRRQTLLVEPPSGGSMPPMAPGLPYLDLSKWSGQFNKPSDATEPVRRFGMGATAAGDPSNMKTIAQTIGVNDPSAGGDVLLTDVVNFGIKVLWEPVVPGTPNTNKFKSGSANFAGPNAALNPDYPFDHLPGGVNPALYNSSNPSTGYGVFDTWSVNNDGTFTYSGGTGNGEDKGNWNGGHFGSNPNTASGVTVPLRVRARAIQITLRIWDRKSQQTRQTTVIQDL